MFLRARQSDSEEESEERAAPELLPEDVAFLRSFRGEDCTSESSLARLTSLLHAKLELITTNQDAQTALGDALKAFTSAHWSCLMTDQRLANPVNDVFKAILYYSDRKDMAWVGALSEKLDFRRRMQLVGYELDAISEQHQIEIEVRRAEEKRVKQRKKGDARRELSFGRLKELKEALVKRPVEIPEVDADAFFGAEFTFASPESD